MVCRPTSKTFRPEIFNLKLRSYIDILIFKRIGINDFEREIIYDLNLVSNLYLFGKHILQQDDQIKTKLFKLFIV